MSFIKVALLLVPCFLSSLAFADNTPLLKPGFPGDQRGQVIAPISNDQIAAWCDFSKQIIVSKNQVLCAYIGPKLVAPAPLSSSAFRRGMSKKRPGTPKDLTPNPYEMTEYGEATEA